MQLLKAALHDHPNALKSFDAWQRNVNIDDLPPSQFELLPLLYRNLAQQGIEQHPWLPRLKGIYRRTWYANQLTLRTLSSALTILRACDIPTLVTGSAALALTTYPEPAQRPISTPEIVVPSDLAETAILKLQTSGWKPNPMLSLADDADYRSWLPGHRFSNGQGQILQLWWHVLPSVPSIEADTEFWGRAVPLTVEDTSTLMLTPTDCLTQACLTAARHTPIRLADAARLINGNIIEWPRLTATAQRHRLGMPMAHSLNALTEIAVSSIPPEVVHELRQIPTLYSRRQAHRAFSVPPAHRRLMHKLWLHYARYRQAAEYQRLPCTPLNFMRYSKYVWQIRQKNR